MSTKHIVTLRTAQLAPEVEDTEAGYEITAKFLLNSIYNGDIYSVEVEKAHHDFNIDNQAEEEDPITQDETIYEIRLDLDAIVNEGESFIPNTDDPNSLIHYITLILDKREPTIMFYDASNNGFTRRRIFVDLQTPIDTSSMDDFDELMNGLK